MEPDIKSKKKATKQTVWRPLKDVYSGAGGGAKTSEMVWMMPI